MPLADLLRERFKVRTRAVENPIRTSIGATAQIVLGNNPNRLGWVVVNLSANPVFLGLTNEVGTDRGVRLNAEGGKASCIWDEDFDITAWAWWGIAPAGASNIYVLEVVEY